MKTDYQNIFNRDFYPTPNEVIDQMMMGEDVSDKVILEPSAGSGNIVNWLVRNGARSVLACEINDTLRRSLTHCDVIASDFMNVTSDEVSHIDMIVMNPPFLHGIEHLKHAYEIAPGGCSIVCILPHNRFVDRDYCGEEKAPWETPKWWMLSIAEKKEIKDKWISEHVKEYMAYIERVSSKTATHKKFMETIELEGYHENIGNVFSQNAERTNDYDIELIKIYKPKEGNNEFDGYLFDKTDNDQYGGSEAGLLPHSKVYELVSRMIDAVQSFDAALDAANKINDIVAPFSNFNIKFGVRGRDGHGETLENISRDRYKKELQKAAWRNVISMFNLGKFATKELREKINLFVEKQTNIPFTMSNIYKMVDMIVQTNGQRMENAICEAFENICKFSPENTDLDKNLRANNRDAWKTNSDYMVNKKFIVPYIAECNEKYGSQPEVKVHYGYHSGSDAEMIDDILKALTYISGKEIDGYHMDRSSGYAFADFVIEKHIGWGEWCECGWFRMKFFKKGTMHFEFIGEEGEKIWAMLNQTYAKRHGWRIGNKTTEPKKPTRKPKQQPKEETTDETPWWDVT